MNEDTMSCMNMLSGCVERISRALVAERGGTS